MTTKYPASLPLPASWSLTPRDLRLAPASTDGDPQARTRSVDQVWTAEATWITTPQQAQAFAAWVRDDLRHGRAWAEMLVPWPCAAGQATKVVKLHGIPQRKHLGGGAWEYTGSLDIRGRVVLSGVSGQTAGIVVEDGVQSASGTITPLAPGVTVVASSASGAYGSFAVNTAGLWTYTLNNSAGAVQSLPAGALVTDQFSVGLSNGQTATITISVLGANDAATLGGQVTGSVAEDGTLTASGQLTITDSDAGQARVVPQTGVAGTYGQFGITATGAWTYTLNNTSHAVQVLTGGQVVTDVFQVRSADLSSSTNVTITITGASDQGSIGGTTTGSVAEDGALTASGAVTPLGSASWVTIVPQTATTARGAWSVLASGAWTYTLNNTAAQSLTAGQTVTESLSVSATDGATGELTVTVTGAQDVATISGVLTGSVTEDITLTASGSATIADPDAGQASFVPQVATAGAYGLFAITSAGAWTYVLDSANSTVQALNTGQTLTDTLPIVSADSSATSNIVITINGRNEGDPYWASVELLLRGETLTDSSSRSVSITQSGTVVLDTAHPSGIGTGSLTFDGAASYLTTGSCSGLDMGTGDFTIEFWGRRNSATNNFQNVLASNVTSFGVGAQGVLMFGEGSGVDSTQRGRWGVAGYGWSTALYTASVPAIGEWHHIAIRRASGVMSMWMDGVQQSSATITNAINFNYGSDTFIGRNPWDGSQGYAQVSIDDLRITKGVARTITVPTVQYPNE